MTDHRFVTGDGFLLTAAMEDAAQLLEARGKATGQHDLRVLAGELLANAQGNRVTVGLLSGMGAHARQQFGPVFQ